MAGSRSNSRGSDNPPSYEESIASAPPIDSNLTWPNSVVTRDEVSSFLQMALTQAIPQNTEPTRGRAYTVTGAPEPHKHRNIINYFENSLDDVDSIDWSHHSIRDLRRQYSENQMMESNSSNRLNTHNQGNRVPSHDIIHWQYVKGEHGNCSNPSIECSQRPSPTSQYPSPSARREEAPSVGSTGRTRFNVLPVNNSRESHSETDMYFSEDTDQIQCPQICGSHSLGALTPLIEEQRPVFSVSEGAIIDTNNSLDERHPSAPSADFDNHMTSTPNCMSIYPNIEDQMMTLIHTAPGRLDEMDKSEKFDESEQKCQRSPEKNVSFWVGNDENLCPNKTVAPNFDDHYTENTFDDGLYKCLKEVKSDPVIYQQPPVNPDYLNNIVYEIPVKHCQNEEEEEKDEVFEDPSGHHKLQISMPQETDQNEVQLPDSEIPVVISSIIVPTLAFKQSDDINRTDSGYSDGFQSSKAEQTQFLPRDKSVTFSDDTKDGEEDLNTHLIDQSNPEADGVFWDGNLYYRPSPQKTSRREGWRRWAAIAFFVFALLTIVLGLALLLIDYHSNVVAGFALMGIGAGLCIPALNYLGGFPTVCG